MDSVLRAKKTQEKMLQLLKTLQQLASAEKNTQDAKSQTESFKNVLSCAKYEAKKLKDRSFPVAAISDDLLGRLSTSENAEKKCQ